MALVEKFKNDIKDAMKSGDKARLEVLRFAFAGIQNAQKEKESKEAGAMLSDEEAVAILQKDAKRRREAIELFRQGGRADLVEKEEAELKIISEYLPAALSKEDIEKIVADLQGQGHADFNALMRETMKVVKGRADGKVVGDAIKNKLGA